MKYIIKQAYDWTCAGYNGKFNASPAQAVCFSSKKEAEAFARKHINTIGKFYKAVALSNKFELLALEALFNFSKSKAKRATYRYYVFDKVGSGRYSSYSVNHTVALVDAFGKHGAKVAGSGNTAPKGGKLGEYIDFEFVK